MQTNSRGCEVELLTRGARELVGVLLLIHLSQWLIHYSRSVFIPGQYMYTHSRNDCDQRDNPISLCAPFIAAD